MRLRFLTVLIWLVSLGLAGCGDDVGGDGELVGAPCAARADCAERCVTGGDFPQGVCSASCSTDDDCPSGTRCIDKEGGICLLACDRPADCRGGYTCKGVTNQGHGGDSLVCIGG